MQNRIQMLEMASDEMIPKEDVLDALTKGNLKIKFGADPSAADLHLGHMVIFNQLRHMQDMGNRVQFLIGDFTAMIGDPTGKSETRPPLSEAQVKENAQSYQDQVFQFLDPEKTDVVYNSTWLSKLNAADVVALSAKYTVARMLERDDFTKRFRSETPISIHEFLYPLFQGYDSLILESDIEVGGTDQKFNLLMGRHLQKESGKKAQGIIMFPILEGLDGVQKMSKSLGNHVGVTDPPNDMFGKLMSIPDTLILRYFKLLTFVSPDDILAMDESMKGGENPRDFKMRLALTIVEHLHSTEDAKVAKAQFEQVFSKGQLPDEMPEIKVESGPQKLINLMVTHQMVSSKKEARRMIAQGAVSINQEKVSSDELQDIVAEDGMVIRVGKRGFYKLLL